MFAAQNQTFPPSLHPPVLPIIEGKRSDFQREDRTVKPLNIKKHEVTVHHTFKEGKGMTIEEFYEKAREAGEGMGKQMWAVLIGAITEAAEETGNKATFKKGKLTQDDILLMLEQVQQNFDEQGNPTAQFIFGSEFAQELKGRDREWREDKSFQARLEELKQRKKAEFNEREARRRLVD